MTREQDGEHHFRQANRLYGEGRYDVALDHYFKAMEYLPGSAEVRNNLAVLLKTLGEHALAIQCLEEALTLKPDYADALGNLGNLCRDAGDLERAISCFHQALTLMPGSPVLWNNLGLSLKLANRFEDAITCLSQARALPGCPPEASFTLAIALLQTGRRKAGWELYQQRWQLPALAARRAPWDAQAPQWQGEDPANKCVVVWAEQGLGDTLQMARFLPALADRFPETRWLLAVEAPLQRLLENLDARIRVVPSGEIPSAMDWHLPIMTLPWLWHQQGWKAVPATPYLHFPEQGSDVSPTTGWPRIGVVWESGSAGIAMLPDREQVSRSLDAVALRQLLALTGVEWVSLQYQGSDRLRELGVPVSDPTDRIRDLADSAAIIASLDCVVTVDTVIAHLAAALGCPVLTMMRFAGGNLFPASGEDFAWYPGMRIIRQSRPEDWSDVIARIH